MGDVIPLRVMLSDDRVPPGMDILSVWLSVPGQDLLVQAWLCAHKKTSMMSCEPCGRHIVAAGKESS